MAIKPKIEFACYVSKDMYGIFTLHPEYSLVGHSHFFGDSNVWVTTSTAELPFPGASAVDECESRLGKRSTELVGIAGESCSASRSISARYDHENKLRKQSVSSVMKNPDFTDGESMPRHYDKMFAGKVLDPAAIAKVYGITDMMQFTALKKILRAGQSERKDLRQDILDSIKALRRMLELMDNQPER